MFLNFHRFGRLSYKICRILFNRFTTTIQILSEKGFLQLSVQIISSYSICRKLQFQKQFYAVIGLHHSWDTLKLVVYFGGKKKSNLNETFLNLLTCDNFFSNFRSVLSNSHTATVFGVIVLLKSDEKLAGI